jgi:hypothetical protein
VLNHCQLFHEQQDRPFRRRPFSDAARAVWRILRGLLWGLRFSQPDPWASGGGMLFSLRLRVANRAMADLLALS